MAVEVVTYRFEDEPETTRYGIRDLKTNEVAGFGPVRGAAVRAAKKINAGTTTLAESYFPFGPATTVYDIQTLGE